MTQVHKRFNIEQVKMSPYGKQGDMADERAAQIKQAK